MIYSSIHGGLGNQMFQYALGLSISLKTNSEFKFDLHKMNNYNLRDFSLNKFNISAKKCEDYISEKYKSNKYKEALEKKINKFGLYTGNKFYEKKEFCYDQSVFSNKKAYFKGYWQSFKYFESIRDIILKEFSLKDDLSEENLSILNKIENSDNSVSIHIRRGDYINNAKNNKIYNVIGLDYYEKAINEINNNFEKPYFFVFSDDIEWVDKNLNISGRVIYVSSDKTNKAEEELILMSKCNHNIIANSTFSWWGAWLNNNEDKLVIAPKIWMKGIKSSKDLIPNTWLKI
ncbi:glycosyl transferase family 11 [Tenacibaculum adriaticum]|uniref:Glycosyl transferase family 11 n=1 Tax=Tenacibaculum adriaticum TaxID=413713 RepID=A0A5S5DN97_9FLAO|nr:alpha-1,2-fucosyltransferase [Tenacibaculum adriaticum]TYP97351.1 glycosyl transferase family 11 [Tenacibaculum adriaticum]